MRPWCAQLRRVHERGLPDQWHPTLCDRSERHQLLSLQWSVGWLPHQGPPGASIARFNSAGTGLVDFNPGTYGSGAGIFTATHGGSGPNFYDNVTIRPPVTHWSLYSHTSFEVTSSLEASLEVSFAQRRATNIQGSDGPTGFPVNVIYPNNAYLPTSVAAAMGGFRPRSAANTGDDVSLINSTTNNVGRLSLGSRETCSPAGTGTRTTPGARPAPGKDSPTTPSSISASRRLSPAPQSNQRL